MTKAEQELVGIFEKNICDKWVNCETSIKPDLDSKCLKCKWYSMFKEIQSNFVSREAVIGAIYECSLKYFPNKPTELMVNIADLKHKIGEIK